MSNHLYAKYNDKRIAISFKTRSIKRHITAAIKGRFHENVTGFCVIKLYEKPVLIELRQAVHKAS